MLCEMLHRALIEIRILGWGGNAEQAAALADAFHELPLLLHSQNFDWRFFRQFLHSYQSKYPRYPAEGSFKPGEYFDYLLLLDKIDKGQQTTTGM
jgi:hypothetical protein